MNNLSLVQLLGLWSSLARSTVTKSKEVLYAVTLAVSPVKGALADPTEVESTIATMSGCSDYFVVDNMVYMGTVNNSSNT